MWLANTSIKRPIFATMVIAAMVLFGIISYPNIGLDLFPKVDLPIVHITTILKGASPEVMDIDVTDKIEEAVNTISGVKNIRSSNTDSRSDVTVEFILERDINFAVQDVREKISVIRSQLPADIEEPIVEKIDLDAAPVMWLNLSGDKSQRELSTYADEELKNQIQKINGIGSIQMTGLRLRQIRLWIKSDKLAAYEITANDVILALKKQNIELPGGRIESKTKEYSIKIKGEFKTPQDFNNLVVG